MKWLSICIGIPLGLVLLYFATVYVASELAGEVVVLHRTAQDGSVDRVRVWIVEDDAGTWIEHGPPRAPWIRRLAHDPIITLERHGMPGRYRATPDPDAHARYHGLRRDAYGFADQLLSMMVDADACTATPVRLEVDTP